MLKRVTALTLLLFFLSGSSFAYHFKTTIVKLPGQVIGAIPNPGTKCASDTVLLVQVKYLNAIVLSCQLDPPAYNGEVITIPFNLTSDIKEWGA